MTVSIMDNPEDSRNQDIPEIIRHLVKVRVMSTGETEEAALMGIEIAAAQILNDAFERESL